MMHQPLREGEGLPGQVEIIDVCIHWGGLLRVQGYLLLVVTPIHIFYIA